MRFLTRILFFAALTTQATAQAPVRIRLGTLAPQGSSYHRILQEMGEKWRTATNGQVQLTIYAGTMGSELELLRRMRAGQLQAAAVTTTGIVSVDPGAAALQSMPMMFRTLDELDYVKAKVTPTLDKRLEDKGFKVLFWADAGWVHYFSREKVERPADFKKLKIFVTAGETEQFDLMKSAGYNPVALEWASVLTSLQTKMIDAMPIIPYYALATQVYTVASYMLDVNWLPLVGALIINKKTWDAMSPATQAAMTAASVEASKQFQARGRQESDESVAAMQKRGLTVVKLPPAVQAEWRTTGEQLNPKVRGTVVPADMFDEVVRLLAEYRSRPAKP